MFDTIKIPADKTNSNRELTLYTFYVGNLMLYIATDFSNTAVGLNILSDKKFKSNIFRYGYDQQF